MKSTVIAAILAPTIALCVSASARPAAAEDTVPQSSAPSAPPSTPPPYEHFVSGDYIFAPTARNEFAPGTSREGPSFAGRAVGEFPLGKIPILLEVNAEQFTYPHPDGVVTHLGSRGASFVPGFNASERDIDARLGIGFNVLRWRVYVAGSYLWQNNNYGYPQLSGAGFGIEKLPDLGRRLSVFGDFFYYPQLQGTYLDPMLGPQTLQYRFSKYEAGVAYSFPVQSATVRPFVEAGWRGTYGWAAANAPIDRHVEGPFLGVGLKI
jgi:hypothetical protein